MNRLTWLGQPWFFAAIAILALNDHVLKSAWPGWVTGKLSDFAGLVVVGTLASVVLGHRWGTVLAGLGFAALKTVPGVAEAAAPLLGGGVTLRDASDLLALVVLPGLWLALRGVSPAQPDRDRRGWAAVGLVAAWFAVTATSPASPVLLDDVWFDNDAFYATVVFPSGSTVPFRSVDGGHSWERLEEIGPEDRDDRRRSSEHCAVDGHCYRFTHCLDEPDDADEVCYSGGPRRLVERRDPGSEWTEVYRFGKGEGSGGAAVNPADGDQFVFLHGTYASGRAGRADWVTADLVREAKNPVSTGHTVAAAPKAVVGLVEVLGSPGATLAVLLLVGALALGRLDGPRARAAVLWGSVALAVALWALHLALAPALVLTIHCVWLGTFFAVVLNERRSGRNGSAH